MQIHQPMNIVLNNQIEASEKSVVALESFPEDDRASLASDVDALLRLITDIHHDLNRHVQRWQNDIAAHAIPYRREVAQSLLDLYVRLEKTSLKAAQLARKVESLNQPLQHKPQFLETWRQLKSVTCFSLDKVEASLAQIARGQSMTLGEFADELSRDLER
jgi:allophanate hydrolase subunit 1